MRLTSGRGPITAKGSRALLGQRGLRPVDGGKVSNASREMPRFHVSRLFWRQRPGRTGREELRRLVQTAEALSQANTVEGRLAETSLHAASRGTREANKPFCVLESFVWKMEASNVLSDFIGSEIF